MNQSILAAVLIALTGPAVAGTALPVQLADGVVVEEAWLQSGPGGSKLFLVVNNNSNAPVTLTGFEIAGMVGAITAPDGARASVAIPQHAELYMTTKGVRVTVPATFEPEQAVPVTVTASIGEPATIMATVLKGDGKLPDHHNYPH